MDRSPIVAYISWQWMLNDQLGTINRYLIRLGLVDPFEPIIWLADPVLAMFSVIVVGTWFRFPFMMITVLAALAAIPDELHEAASLDGANMIQRFRDVTLPLIMPVSIIAILLQAIWTFNDFALTFVLTGAGLLTRPLPLILMAYREAFQRFNIGYGTSLAVISMVLMLAVGTVYLRLQSRKTRLPEGESAMENVPAAEAALVSVADRPYFVPRRGRRVAQIASSVASHAILARPRPLCPRALARGAEYVIQNET